MTDLISFINTHRAFIFIGYLILFVSITLSFFMLLWRSVPFEPISGGRRTHAVALFRRLWPLGVRTQLMIGYGIIFFFLLLIVSIIGMTGIRSTLVQGMDSELQHHANRIASGIALTNGNINITDITGQLPGLHDGTTTRIPAATAPINISTAPLVRVLDTQRHIIYASPAFAALVIPARSIDLPLSGEAFTLTVNTSFNLRDNQQVRLYSMPLFDQGRVYGVLQLGTSQDTLNANQTILVVALFLLLPVIFLLGMLASYALAARAFRPIHRLAQTARTLDITNLRQRVPVPPARDDVHYLALMFNKMLGRLENSFTQQRRFIADASHELRTPVAAIRSMTDVALLQDATPQEYAAVLHEVNAEAERLGHLINQLLALARYDEAHAPLERDCVRLDLLVMDVAASLDCLASERGVTLSLGAMAPAAIQGDTARLIQMLMSLVDNALLYTNPGGTVTLSVTNKNTQALVTVADTGIGIAPADLPHIFERFYRADPARSRIAGGSGLGLALAESVARAHGGMLTVASTVGEGSVFTILLPLRAMAHLLAVAQGRAML